MSKLRKCDLCGETVLFPLTEMRQQIEVAFYGKGLVFHIEVENTYTIPNPQSGLRREFDSIIAVPVGKDPDLDLCPECFRKAITALKAQLESLISQ